MDINIQNIHKDFGSFKALDGVDLDIESGELIALLGPSGSGKTTLLRVIAGLEFADAGAIRFGTEDMAQVPVRERQVGFVFQHYALFKHMTVLDNVSFGLKVRKDKPSAEAIRKRALELLDLVQLSGLEKRYPAQLSGGQRQRVALARALAIDPKVLLLDEPFGALDAKVRKDLRRWLRELHDQTGVTTVFVTHDQEEALELADRVVIMNKGRIEQVGHVDTVYEQPANPFVFDFLGGTNVIKVEVDQQQVRLASGVEPIAQTETEVNGSALLYVRPGDIRLANEGAPGLAARIARVHRTGPLVRIDARVVGIDAPLSIELPHLHHDTGAFQAGAELRLRLLQFSIYPPPVPSSTNVAPSDALGVAASRRRSR